MDITPADWRRIFELCDSAMELDVAEREAWLEALDGDAARLREPLRELIAQQSQVLPALRQPAAAPEATNVRTRAQPGAGADASRVLGPAVGNFAAGLIEADELRTEIARYLRSHPEQRGGAAAWLQQLVGAGRLPSSVPEDLRDLLAAPPPEPRPVSRPAPRSPPQPAHVQATSPRHTSAAALTTTPAAGELHAGMTLKDRFVLLEELGRGGMGLVFKVRDQLSEQANERRPYLALKVLSEEFKEHPESFIALQRECKRARMLKHDNVISVYDFDRDGAHWYITMEYLEGRTLDLLLRTDFAGGLPLEQALPIIRCIAGALDCGHGKAIIHSDLKPGNVFMCNDGTLKVLDFGISRPMKPVDATSEHTLFDPGTRLGGLTPAYASLEMWNRAPPDPRDDIYALACLSYELLTGRHPFGRRPAHEALQENLQPARITTLERAHWDALRRGLAYRREDRTPTITEFLAPFQPRSFMRRHAAKAGGIAAALVVGAAAAAWHYSADIRDQLGQLSQDQAEDVRPPPPATNLTAEQREEIDQDIVLAEGYLADTRTANTPEKLSYILSEGANSVNEILAHALSIDPGNVRALQLRGKVEDMYAQRARALLDMGKVGDAWGLVSNGSKVQPRPGSALRKLRREICERQPALCAAPRP